MPPEQTGADPGAAGADATAQQQTQQTTQQQTDAAAQQQQTQQQTTQADWRDGLVGDLKEFATRLASPHDAVKSAFDLRKQISTAIKKPGPDAKPEELAAFRKALGAGEKPEDYVFPAKEGVEPTETDKAIQGKVAEVLLKHNVPIAAAGELGAVVAELADSIDAENNRLATEGRAASEAALKKEWGGDYTANVELAKRAIQAFGGEPLKAFLNETHINGIKLGDHPDMIRAFGQVGRRMGEGTFIGAVGNDQRQTLIEERDKLMRENPPGTDKYKAVEKRIREINVAVYGTGPIVGAEGRAI